ncbi:MAG: tape measure protein, partial [Elusimicrobiales bacterium]|nr:tape measure protein [Elusimicrobiales bacterium]
MADKKATLWLQLKDDISNGLAKIGGSFDKLANNLRKGGVVFGVVAAGLTYVGSALLTASGKMEQWTVSFETMLGSSARANLLMSQIRDFAAKTPFELPGLVMASKQLLAVGFGAKEIIPTLKAVGDVAAGLSIPIDRLILNLGQVKTQGKLTGRELRDFAVAGVPVLSELAKNMFGVAEASEAQKKQVADMVSKGKIGFKQVAEAFQTMAGEGGTFFNLMDKQSKTFLGIISNINDEVFQLMESFGKLLLPAAKKVVIIIAELVGWMKNLSQPVKIAILIVGGLTLAFSGLLAGAAAFIVIAPTLAAAWVVAVGPIGWVTLAIIGFSTALVAAIGHVMGLKKAMAGVSTAGLSMLEKNLIAVNNELFKTKKTLDALRRNEQQDTERYKKAAQKYSDLTKAKLRLEKEFQKQKDALKKADVK